MTWYPRDASVFALRGKDVRDLVQRLTTNDVLKATGWVGNVFTSEKGRLLALVSLHIDNAGMTVVVAGGADRLMQYIDDMTFREDVTIVPMPGHRVVTSLAGNEELLLVRGTHRIEPDAQADGSAEEFDAWRIARGIPVWGRELSEERNPHEARLGAYIDWNKGCYVGQEVVARLDTYKKVQRHLVKLEAPAVGPLLLNGEHVGDITSAKNGRALGYTKQEDVTAYDGGVRVIPW